VVKSTCRAAMLVTAKTSRDAATSSTSGICTLGRQRSSDFAEPLEIDLAGVASICEFVAVLHGRHWHDSEYSHDYSAIALADTLNIRGNHKVNGQGPSFFGMRTHHFIIALIAILIAVALLSNYYLW